MNTRQIEIIYVEDDLNLSMVVEDFLLLQGYKVIHFENAESCLSMWENHQPDICILDIMLPKMNGYQLAARVKQRNEKLPIIFLSAKNQVKDKVQGFEIGIDDYITKPFSTIELDLRIKAILKRVQNSKPVDDMTPMLVKLGKITYNEAELLIETPIENISLTRKENHLLKCLITHQNEVLKRDDLLLEVWGENNHQNSRSMDVYLSKLRKILSAEERISITNYHGTGFKLDTSQL